MADNPAEVLLDFQVAAYGLLWLRLVLYSAVYFGFLLLQLLQNDFLNIAVWQPVNGLMLVSFVIHAVSLEAISRVANTRRVLKAVFLFDAVAIVVLMAVFGRATSAFLFFSLLNCALGGVTLGTEFGLQLGLWSAALINILVALSPKFMPDQMQATWLVNNLSILTVSALGGFLGDQIEFITTDLRETREDVKSLTDFNEIIIEHIPSGIMMVDQKRGIVRANRGAAKIFGDLSLVGRPLRDVAPELVAEIQLYESNPNAAFHRAEVDHYNYRREKSLLEVIISSVKAPVPALSSFARHPGVQRGQPEKQYILLLQNVTELRGLEFELQQKETLAAVGQLAAGIAHEIRNPLASISGSVQLLQANVKTVTPEEGKLFKIILKEIDRLNNLITEFLDFVRPSVRIEDPVPINTLLKEVGEAMKLNERLNREVKLTLDTRAGKLIYGNHDKLKQAFLNILINAYQAMTDTLHPEITIESYDSEDHRVVVIIRDNGCGISKDNMRRLFQPFHTTKAGGTGLGLAITRKIVESHGGEIKVESDLGRGTRFAVILPTRTINQQNAHDTEPTGGTSRGGAST